MNSETLDRVAYRAWWEAEGREERRLFAACHNSLAGATSMLGHRVYGAPLAKADDSRG